MHWLDVGDKNNRFFHNDVKTREIRNAIREVICPDGSIATREEDIKKEAERFFVELLTYIQGRTQKFFFVGSNQTKN